MAYDYPFRTASEQLKRDVWGKGRIVPDKGNAHWDPAEWRYDCCGKPIKYTEHGNIKSDVGWEIDHIKPVARGGIDAIDNLQPLQWEKNREKGDTFPWYP